MVTNPLPLSNVLNIATLVSPAAVTGPNFNQALIVGPSAHIPSVGANSRLRLYYNLSELSSDNFLPTDPEYLAAEVYFGQIPAPSSLWIGRQDLTAINAATLGTTGGANYTLGDILTVTQSGASLGQLQVLSTGTALAESTTATVTNASASITVSDGTGIAAGQVIAGTGISVGTTVTHVAGTTITMSAPATHDGTGVAVTFTNTGVVATFQLVVASRGTGYTVANNLATSGGTGTGCLIDITVIGETPVMALQACRTVNADWYCCMFVGTATDAQHMAIAAFIEAAAPASTYFVTTSESSVLAAPSASLPATLQAEKYNRTCCAYSTTQGGVYPNNAYAAASFMGIAMGRNTGATGSYFDVMFKAVAGVASEPLTPTQVNAICGTVDRSSPGLNCNCVLLYQGGYSWWQPAIMASGIFFDEILNLDMLASDMQYSGIVLLTSVPSLPITDAGVLMMKAALGGACDRASARGFIAPSGTWSGLKIGVGSTAINTGDALPKGYYLYSPAVSTLSQQQRAARVMPPVTVLLIEAQSGHSLSVTVNVQR